MTWTLSESCISRQSCQNKKKKATNRSKSILNKHKSALNNT